jgi:hypothetical protein
LAELPVLKQVEGDEAIGGLWPSARPFFMLKLVIIETGFSGIYYSM